MLRLRHKPSTFPSLHDSTLKHKLLNVLSSKDSKAVCAVTAGLRGAFLIAHIKDISVSNQIQILSV